MAGQCNKGRGVLPEDLLCASEGLRGQDAWWPFLIKPNLAGFGVDINFFINKFELEECAKGTNIGNVSDDVVALPQE